MEELSPPRCTFLVGLKPAHQLLRCLILMTGLTSTAVLIVKDGEIQILASSPDGSTHASMNMEALIAASWDSGWFAIQFDLSVWIELLRPSISQQETESLWIYKIGVFPDLSCLVGNDDIPIRLDNTQFAQEKGVDMKYLGSLASHPVKIHMRTQCLRDVLMAFAPKYVHAGLMVMNDRVAWNTIAGEFTYNAKNADCLIEGVEKGTGHYLLVRWRSSKVLHLASTHCEEVSICNLVHPDWLGWIRFTFFFDGVIPFLYLMRGSSYVLNL